jgi:hypothetical protein
MQSHTRTTLVALAVVIIFTNFLVASVNGTSLESTGASIDIFTQKTSHNGKGFNVSSDAYGPDDEVIIYALTIYNNYSAALIQVAFEIQGPKNPVQNISIYEVVQTNESGIATTSFRIGLNNTINFGEWTVVASARIVDSLVQDYLSFKAGWIVQITSLKTINEEGVEQTQFNREQSVGVDLTLKNIAMTDKTTTIAITMYDSLNISINSLQIGNFIVPANETLVHTNYFLLIPKSAFLGNAVVSVCAYNSLGEIKIPYSPKVSKNFLIIDHDIAILSVQPSSESVFKGEDVRISVIVKNVGDKTESFNVSAYYNQTIIGVVFVNNLDPDVNTTIIFVWNTSQVSEGFYQISASAPLPTDTTPADNTFYDGTVQVKAKPLTHDIAILNVQPSTNTAYIGDTIDITVTVKNLGDTPENFNITAYYNSTKIQTIQVNNLQPQAYQTLTFHWNTQDTTTGNYTISATATPITGEENLENNNYTDGTIQIKAKPTTHDIAVLNVTPWSRLISIGDTLKVNVTAKNNGTQTESFDLTLYYDQTAAITTHVNNLAAYTETIITFNWNTADVPAGNHTLKAYATPLSNEQNTDNNQYVDGTVKFITPTKGLSMPELFYWFLLLLSLLIIFILLFLLLYRRREKSKNSFYSGWTAWYYAYDLRTKLPKPKT